MKKSLSKILAIVFVGVLSLTLVLNTNPIANIMADEENTKEEVETVAEEVETTEETPSVEADETSIDVVAEPKAEQIAFKSAANVMGRALMSSRLPEAAWSGWLNETMRGDWSNIRLFDADKSVNINPSMVGTRFTYYNAQPGGGVPSFWRAVADTGSEKEVILMSNVGSNIEDQQLSTKADWAVKMDVQLGVNSDGTGDIRENLMEIKYGHMRGPNVETMTVRIHSISTDYVHDLTLSKSTFLEIRDGTKPIIRKAIGPPDMFDVAQELTIINDYDSSTDTTTVTINVGGESIVMPNATFGNIDPIAEYFTINTIMHWRAPLITFDTAYPVGLESYVELDESLLTYTNFNPIFESFIWKDSSGKVLDENSKVSVGDKLTVTVNMKNDLETGDKIPSKLYVDSVDGGTTDHSVAGNDYILLNKNTVPQVINVTVGAGDIGSQVSLGLRSRDSFFRKEILGETKGPKIGGDVDYESTSMKVMELKRDTTGNVMKDGSGNAEYVEADDQNILTQDSYIKMEGSFKNNRLSEVAKVKLGLDDTKALGFDFTQIRDLKMVNGTGSANDLINGTGVNFTLPANSGTASFSFVIPVKQSAVGKPFNVGEQSIKYNLETSYVVSGIETKVLWEQNDLVSNTTLRPIKDVDMELTTSDVSLERGQTFELLNETGSLLAFTGSNGGTTDWSKLRLQHQGVATDWAKFGLATSSEANGTVGAFVPDGTTMKTIVSYNEVLQLNGKAYYTRKGGTQEETPRTKTKEINLTVNGGTISPEGFVDIPSFVGLKDANGIDSKHAGEKATVKLKDHAPAGVDFEISGDTDFLVSDAKESYVVSLYHENKVEMSKVNKKATVTTLNDANKSKVVWYNTPMDVKKVGSYLGTMTFYIKVN